MSRRMNFIRQTQKFHRLGAPRACFFIDSCAESCAILSAFLHDGMRLSSSDRFLLPSSNNCNYCIASHTASAFGKGMTDAMFKELQAVIGMANETNKLVTGYQVEVDQRFQPPLAR